MRELLSDCPGDALMLPPGLLGSGVSVNWDIRCKAKFDQYDASWHQLLGHSILRLSGWQLLPAPPIATDQLALFLDALGSLRDTGVLNHPLLNPQPATPTPTMSERRRQAKHDRKIAQSSMVVDVIGKLEAEGLTIVYTDGSSKKVYGIGWVGRCGIFC